MCPAKTDYPSKKIHFFSRLKRVNAVRRGTAMRERVEKESDKDAFESDNDEIGGISVQTFSPLLASSAFLLEYEN